METFEVERAVARELSPQEKLLWSGQPEQGIRLRPSDALMIPFSLMWGGFAIFWEATAITTNAPWLFKLWGIPFVLVGLYIMVGRFFADARERRNTIYAVTSERVIILAGLFARSVRSFPLKGLREISFSEGHNGRGTITLGAEYAAWSSGTGWPGGRKQLPPSLQGIVNAREVYDLLLKQQAAAA